MIVIQTFLPPTWIRSKWSTGQQHGERSLVGSSWLLSSLLPSSGLYTKGKETNCSLWWCLICNLNNPGAPGCWSCMLISKIDIASGVKICFSYCFIVLEILSYVAFGLPLCTIVLCRYYTDKCTLLYVAKYSLNNLKDNPCYKVNGKRLVKINNLLTKRTVFPLILWWINAL